LNRAKKCGLKEIVHLQGVSQKMKTHGAVIFSVKDNRQPTKANRPGMGQGKKVMLGERHDFELADITIFRHRQYTLTGNR